MEKGFGIQHSTLLRAHEWSGGMANGFSVCGKLFQGGKAVNVLLKSTGVLNAAVKKILRVGRPEGNGRFGHLSRRCVTSGLSRVNTV